MAQASPTSIEANIHGDVSGQVAVGQNIVQIGQVTGGVVYVVAPGDRPEVRPRAAPVLMLPRAFPGLLDRHLELDAADSAMDSGQVVEASGPSGLGKTSLLRRLAHHRAVEGFPDGIVYLSVRNRPLEDVHQALFDAFHESTGVPYRASEAEVRNALAGRRALVLLDDLALGREETQALVDAFPSLVLVLATEERRLWGEACGIALSGLPGDDALVLLERTLGRPLAANEGPAGAELVRVLGGRPLDLVQAAAGAARDGMALGELAARLAVPGAPDALVRERIEARPEPHRRILALLAAIAGVTLASEQVQALAGDPGAAEVLDVLVDAALVETDGAGYCLSEGLAGPAVGALDVAGAVQRAVAHLPSATGTPPADALLGLLDHAVGARRWHDALALARAVEPELVLGLRWGSWRAVLDVALEASRAVGDRAAEAWALHQLGTRSTALGDLERAESLLRSAAELREAIGDGEAAAVSRANLAHRAVPEVPREPPATPASPAPPPAPPPAPLRSPWVTAALVVVGVVAVVVVASIAAREWIGHWLDGLVEPPGTGIARGLGIAPSRLDFGATGLPAAPGSPRLVRVTNRADGPVAIASVSVDGDGAFAIAEEGCTGEALAPGASCTVAVGFAPAALGAFGARLLVESEDPGPGRVEAVLAGRAVAPRVRALPASLSFSGLEAGAAAQGSVEVLNEGPGPAALDAITLEGDQRLVLAGGSCAAGEAIAPGGACTLDVRVVAAREGMVSGALLLAGAFEGSPLRVPIEALAAATVAPVPALGVEPGRVDFGVLDVGAPRVRRPVVVRNEGDVEARVVAVLEGPDADAFSLESGCGAAPLAPGRACELIVGFSPREARGHAAAVRVAPEGAAPERVVERAIELAGAGREPAAVEPAARAVLEPTSLRFAALEVGTRSRPQSAALRNDGAGAVTVRRVYVDGEHARDFRVVANRCSRQTVVTRQRCEVSVQFTPGGEGVREAVLVIEEAAGGVVHRLPLTGAGERAARQGAPAVAVEPGALRFDARAIGTRVSGTAKVRSVGGATLSVRSVTIEGPAAGDFSLTGDRCSARALAPGRDCELRVVFAPSAAGAREAALVVRSDAAGPAVRVPLLGTGIRRAAPPVPLPVLPEAEPPASAQPPRPEPTPWPEVRLPDLPSVPPLDTGGESAAPSRGAGAAPGTAEPGPGPGDKTETGTFAVPALPLQLLDLARLADRTGTDSGATRPAAPDLVVARLAAGEAKTGTDGEIRVPVQVTLENRGASAGRFAVALLYDGDNQVAFVVSGQSDRWRPEVKGLAAGASTSLRGTALFPSSLAGRTVRLDAEVDSCLGVEFAAEHCRVDEANEDNNRSAGGAKVALPGFRLMVPVQPTEPKTSRGIIDGLKGLQ